MTVLHTIKKRIITCLKCNVVLNTANQSLSRSRQLGYNGRKCKHAQSVRKVSLERRSRPFNRRCLKSLMGITQRTEVVGTGRYGRRTNSHCLVFSQSHP